MQYLALYVVLLVFILLSFLRGKHVLFNIIIMAYPTAVIYKALLEVGAGKMLDDLNFGASIFTMHLILFLIVLVPVYIALFRITNSFRLGHSLKGAVESVVLSIGIVLLTIGVCFHILPDTDVFNLSKGFESFFQSDLGFLICVALPMVSVFLLSKRSMDFPQ